MGICGSVIFRFLPRWALKMVFDDMEIYVANVAQETLGAYSFGRYGEEEWVKCIEFMAQSNFSEGEAVWVLRSKHMRWNADACDGKSMSECFKRYMFDNHNTVLFDLLSEGFNTDFDFSDYYESEFTE